MSAQVVSSIPGRTRFKVGPKRRNHQEMERLASGLEAHPDVRDVQYNVQTGSILVYHDPHQSDVHEISRVLRDLGCVFSGVTGTSDLVSIDDQSGNKLDFNSAIADLNQQVLQATNGLVDLRYVLPIGLGALSVLQFLTFGWQFDIVPWYILAYFAIDSFIKLNFDEDPNTQSS
jgi:hypothetical protein